MQFITEREKKIQTDLVNKLSWIWIIVNAGVMLTGFFIYTPASFTRWVANIIIVTGIGLASIILNHYNYTKIAAYVLTGCLFLHIVRLTYNGGGTTLPGILNFIPIVLTTGFLLGRKKGIIMAILCIVATFVVAMLETQGLLQEVNFMRSPVGRAIALVLPISIATAIQYFAVGHLNIDLIELKQEILKREEIERVKEKTVYNLGERVKELKTLYTIGRILHNEDATIHELFKEIIEVVPHGWQYPDITAARLCIAEKQYVTSNYQSSQFCQKGQIKTAKGTNVSIEVVYLEAMPNFDEGPFLKEERDLINMLVEMIKIDLERRERSAELKDYKYAIDIATIVSISKMDGSFSFVNENFCKVSKYSFEELIGQQHSILWSGYHSLGYFSDLEIAMQNGEPYKGEFCNKAKDGTLYWVDATIVPFLDETGKVYQYLSIIQDITNRKKIDLQLQQSEERNRAMIDNMSDALLLLNEDLQIIYQSNSVKRISGYAHEDRKTNNIYELIHPDDVHILESTIKKVIANPNSPINYQLRIVHKTGKHIWIDGSVVNLLNNGNVGAVMINYSDITERKNATELFNYQFYNSPDTILIVNRDFIIETINRVTRGSFDIEKVIGKDAIEVLPPESREISRAALTKCFETGENQEFENALTLGRWVRSRMVPMVVDGKITHVMIFASDNTQRKKAEEEIIKSERTLKKITSQVPGNTYMFEIEETGNTKTLFLSRGTDEINYSFDEKDPDSATRKLIEALHQDDKQLWIDMMKKAYQDEAPISFQYRIWLNNQLRWRWFRAIPEKVNDGKVMWYGGAQDITPIVDYIASTEQIIFDISHVIRRPISSMLGLAGLIMDNEIDESEFREIAQKMLNISEEMDKFVRELNEVYNEKRQNAELKIDISSLIDKRNSLFS